MSSNRWLVVAALALLLLVIGSIVVGTNRRGETEFPAGSPEAAVQQYVRAVEQQDAIALQALLSPDARTRCELATIRQALRSPSERDLRVTLRDVKTTDDQSVIRVRVTESTGAEPFESGSYDHDETFDMLRVGGTWLVDQPTWPIYCPPRPIRTPTVTPAPATPSPTSAPQ